MAALDKLAKLMQLKKMQDDLAYRSQKYAYDLKQDEILNEYKKKNYTLQKLVSDRAEAAAKRKLQKDAAKQEFAQDYTAILPDIMEYNKGDKEGFLSDMREFGQEYKEVPQNFMRDSLKMYEDVQGDAYKPPAPTRQSQYVVSEYISKYGRPPSNQEEWATAEAIAYSDDPKRGTWQDRLQKYSDISTSNKFVWKGKQGNEGITFDPKENVITAIPMPGGGAMDPVVDKPLPEPELEFLNKAKSISRELDYLDNVMNSGDDWESWVGMYDAPKGRLQDVTGIGGVPQRATFHQTVENIRNSIIYLNSGKAITDTEFERLTKAMPDPKTDEKTFKAQFDRFKQVFNDVKNDRINTLREQPGYKHSLGAAGYPEPTQPNQTPTPSGKGGSLDLNQFWEKE